MIASIICQSALSLFLAGWIGTSRGAEAKSNWPQFRGPNASGVSLDPRVPVRWSATENVEWKTEIAGRSWSSPVIWGNKVFLTSVINQGDSEPPKKVFILGVIVRNLPSQNICGKFCASILRQEKSNGRGSFIAAHLNRQSTSKAATGQRRPSLMPKEFTLSLAESVFLRSATMANPSGLSLWKLAKSDMAGVQLPHQFYTMAAYSWSTTPTIRPNSSPSIRRRAKKLGESIAMKKATGPPLYLEEQTTHRTDHLRHDCRAKL